MPTLIDNVKTRIEVASIEKALPSYEALADSHDVDRMSFPEFDLAIVGPFMLVQGDPEVVARFRRSATLIVTDLDGAVGAFTSQGGKVLDGPVDSGGGIRTIVTDRDGNVFECYLPGAH